MSSVASSLYDEDQRANCYTCEESKGGMIKVKGQEHRLECRKFTEFGNMFETMQAIQMTSIFMMGLIDVVEIGVDSGRLSFGTHFEFEAQSRGGGGIDKYSCAVDYQIPQMTRHEKLGHTERVYVHFKGCPSKLISTELQSMWYTNDSYSDTTNTDNELTDVLVMSARKAVAEQAEFSDIIGVYGGANKKARAYDGILAQAYWAYTLMAYFHSVQFTIDESVLVDGAFLHAKYAGSQSTIDLELDSTQPTDATINRYATRAELYQALVNFLNEDVLTEGGRKYVDATYNLNDIIVTSKWTEELVDLQIFVDEKPTVENWYDCDNTSGVTYETLQGAMPIDERPFLVEFQRYTKENILTELPNDIYLATRDIDQALKPMGTEWALYIDPYVWEMYQHARMIRDSFAVQASLEEKYNIHTVPALGENGGTGLWFVTLESQTQELRNVAHLVDTVRADSDLSDIYVGPADFKCSEVEIKYDTLHGVTVKDFRLFASNLLCSPFVKTFENKQPWEKTLPYIPCWNRKVRDSFLDPNTVGKCQIRAQFEITDQYQNSALYAIPTTSGVPDIRVLEDGETLPFGALPVFEIQIEDRTVGIRADQLEDVEYEYVVTTSDGAEIVYTDKNPIIQYVGNMAGTAFNVQQTVTIDGLDCTSEYDASTSENAFPFRMAGACDSLDVRLEGRIDKTNDYTVTSAVWNSTMNITADGTPDSIDLTSNSNDDAEGAAELVNAYLEANGFAGVAVGDNDTNTLTITGSVDVVFVDIDGGSAFNRVHLITVIDATDWDVADGIGTIEIDTSCQGGGGDVQFTELPYLEEISTCSGTGWTIEANIVSKLGCTLEGLTVDVDEVGAGEESVSFVIEQ